jgi:PIN domain nuclease of toxin-antitoxin system
MRALLDTQVFLWWNIDDERLTSTARDFITDGGNELFLSAASAWEIAIKASKGRLTLPEPPSEYIARRMVQHRLLPLSIELSHALQVYDLPDLHSDPFDRLLVAQSQLESLPILTADKDMPRYGVDIIW